jgi:hypothetical protein
MQVARKIPASGTNGGRRRQLANAADTAADKMQCLSKFASHPGPFEPTAAGSDQAGGACIGNDLGARGGAELLDRAR